MRILRVRLVIFLGATRSIRLEMLTRSEESNNIGLILALRNLSKIMQQLPVLLLYLHEPTKIGAVVFIGRCRTVIYNMTLNLRLDVPDDFSPTLVLLLVY